MKLFSGLLKLRESLLIRDPFIFRWLIKCLTNTQSRTVFRTVEDTGNVKVFVSCPVSIWLNRYVFVKFSFPISNSHFWNAARCYAVIGKHGNYRFIPFVLTNENDNVLDLLAFKPKLIQHYMLNQQKMEEIKKAFN